MSSYTDAPPELARKLQAVDYASQFPMSEFFDRLRERGVDISRTFEGATMRDSDWSQLDFTGVSIRGAVLKNCTFHVGRISEEQLSSVREADKVKLIDDSGSVVKIFNK